MMLMAMEHRGGCGCEDTTGDGAGMLTALPHEFIAKVAKQDLGVDLPPPGSFGAGLVFLPTDLEEREKCKQAVNQLIEECGQKLVGWRNVPQATEAANIGPAARTAEPFIEMLIVAGRRHEQKDGVVFKADGSILSFTPVADSDGRLVTITLRTNLLLPDGRYLRTDDLVLEERVALKW